MGVRTTNRNPSANEHPDDPRDPQDRHEYPPQRRADRQADASTGDMRGSGRQQSNASTAYVLEPGGPCNVYRWDMEAATLVLERVLHPPRVLGADLVQLPLLPSGAAGDLSTSAGEAVAQMPSWIQSLRQPGAGAAAAEQAAVMGPSLLALLLAEPANPPGTRVGIRLLGAIRLQQSGRQWRELHPDQLGAGPAAPGVSDVADEVSHHLVADYIAFGVPAADPALAHVATLGDLPQDVTDRLHHALRMLAPEALAASHETWLSAEAIWSLYREARAALRRAERAEVAATAPELPGERLSAPRAAPPSRAARPGRTARGAPGAAGAPPAVLPAWRELSPVTPAELRALGEAAYSAPEHLLRFVPHRFEHYLGELLLPDERVLFFVESPALTIRGWSGAVDLRGGRVRSGFSSGRGLDLSNPFGRLRARHLYGGALLVTDRQILHLRDYVPPDVTLVEWGYLAQSWPLGRVVGVQVLAAGIPLNVATLASWPPQVLAHLAGTAPFSEVTVPDRFARLVVALEGREGVEVVGAAFPAETEPVLVRAAERIQRFVPAAGGAATAGGSVRQGAGLRVVPHVEPWQTTEQEARELETLGGLVPPATVRALEEAMQATLATLGVQGAGEQVLAQARTPDVGGEQKEVPALLTLTNQRLLLARRLVTAAGDAASSPVGVQTWPLAALTSATLQQSMLGSGLIAHLPRVARPSEQGRAPTPTVERISVAFPSPLLVPFRALYTRLRLLIGGSPYDGYRTA